METELTRLDQEGQARAHAKVYGRKVAAKAHEEIVKVIKRVTLSIQKLRAAEAEQEETR